MCDPVTNSIRRFSSRTQALGDRAVRAVDFLADARAVRRLTWKKWRNSHVRAPRHKQNNWTRRRSGTYSETVWEKLFENFAANFRDAWSAWYYVPYVCVRKKKRDDLIIIFRWANSVVWERRESSLKKITYKRHACSSVFITNATLLPPEIGRCLLGPYFGNDTLRKVSPIQGDYFGTSYTLLGVIGVYFFFVEKTDFRSSRVFVIIFYGPYPVYVRFVYATVPRLLLSFDTHGHHVRYFSDGRFLRKFTRVHFENRTEDGTRLRLIANHPRYHRRCKFFTRGEALRALHDRTRLIKIIRVVNLTTIGTTSVIYIP